MDIINTQEYLDAMQQIQPLLSAKFTKLFQESRATHSNLHKEMVENFAKVHQDAGFND